MRLVLLLPFVLVTYALPTPPRHSPRGINVLEDVLLFDAPAFQDPNTNETLVGLQSFVFLRQIDLTPFSSAVSSALSKVGIDVGDKIAQVLDRTKLLAAIGRSGQEVEVNVDGCSTVATLSKTSALPDLGMALQNVSVGQCSSTAALTGQVKLSVIDTRKLQATIFPSSPDGFGVISGVQMHTVSLTYLLLTCVLHQISMIQSKSAILLTRSNSRRQLCLMTRNRLLACQNSTPPSPAPSTPRHSSMYPDLLSSYTHSSKISLPPHTLRQEVLSCSRISH